MPTFSLLKNLLMASPHTLSNTQAVRKPSGVLRGKPQLLVPCCSHAPSHSALGLNSHVTGSQRPRCSPAMGITTHHHITFTAPVSSGRTATVSEFCCWWDFSLCENINAQNARTVSVNVSPRMYKQRWLNCTGKASGRTFPAEETCSAKALSL